MFIAIIYGTGNHNLCIIYADENHKKVRVSDENPFLFHFANRDLLVAGLNPVPLQCLVSETYR